jgi:molybdate transport system substrate-binding protein
MKTVTDAGLAAPTPTIFARNRLEIAVPKGNPAHLTGLADFANPRFKTVLCASQVPCGSAAVKVFALAGITPKPVTYADDVKAALSQVALDEVDGALVYHTDVLAAGNKVEGISFPESEKVINDYPIVVLKSSSHGDVAQAFVDFVASAHGRSVLTAAGFEGP